MDIRSCGFFVVLVTLLSSWGSACANPKGRAPAPDVGTTTPTALGAQTANARPGDDEGNMTLDRMDAVIRAVGSDVKRDGGRWTFTVGGTELTCITDERADRMRVIAPVTELSAVTAEQHRAIAEANFHTALDARYAASGGMLFSAFLHPLRSLRSADLRSGIIQVVNLVRTFGSSYSSSNLIFGRRAAPETGI